MDTLADMFTIMRNAQAVGKETAVVPYSKLKARILEILSREGFIKEASVKGKKSKKIIEAALSYNEAGRGRISGISRVSKLSRRVYAPSERIKIISKGRLMIVSTPKGVLTGDEAAKHGVGGEIICKVN